MFFQHSHAPRYSNEKMLKIKAFSWGNMAEGRIGVVQTAHGPLNICGHRVRGENHLIESGR